MPLIILALAVQDAGELVRRLRSEDAAVRDAATRKLKELGGDAVPALEEASRDPDLEVAERARVVLRVLAVRDELSPRLRAAMPGVEDRLAADPHAWTEVLRLTLAHPHLRREELEVLGPRAIRGAAGVHELNAICDLAVDRRLRSAVPALIELLKDDRPEARAIAVRALRKSRARSAAADIAALLNDEDPDVRRAAVDAIGSCARPRRSSLRSSRWRTGTTGSVSRPSMCSGLPRARPPPAPCFRCWRIPTSMFGRPPRRRWGN